MQNSYTKKNLDYNKAIKIRRVATDFTSEELDHVLSWSLHRKTTNDTYWSDDNIYWIAVVPSSSQDDFPVPLFICMSTRKYPEAPAEVKTLRSLLSNDPFVNIKCIACRYSPSDKEYLIVPINIVTAGGGAYTACDIPKHNLSPIYDWDRHISDLRRAWLDEISEHLLEKTKNKCWYCGVKLFFFNPNKDQYGRTIDPSAKQKRSKFNIDHQTPLSRDGSDNLDNLVACCAFCNNSKGKKTLAEFREFSAQKSISAFPDLSFEEKDRFLKAYKFWFERERS